MTLWLGSIPSLDSWTLDMGMCVEVLLYTVESIWLSHLCMFLTHVYIHTYTHICIHIYTYVYMNVCIYVCIYAYQTEPTLVLR